MNTNHIELAKINVFCLKKQHTFAVKGSPQSRHTTENTKVIMNLTNHCFLNFDNHTLGKTSRRLSTIQKVMTLWKITHQNTYKCMYFDGGDLTFCSILQFGWLPRWLPISANMGMLCAIGVDIFAFSKFYFREEFLVTISRSYSRRWIGFSNSVLLFDTSFTSLLVSINQWLGYGKLLTIRKSMSVVNIPKRGLIYWYS